MTYKLFLDDERNPQDVTWVALPDGPWVVVRSLAEFVGHITEHGVPDFIAFDHDLGPDHYRQDYNDGKTGMDCAKWLVVHCLGNGYKLPDFVVHSMNPIGRANIWWLLTKAKEHQGTI